MPKSTPPTRINEAPRSPMTPSGLPPRTLVATAGKTTSGASALRSRDDCHCDDGPERLSARAARHRW